VIQTGAKGRHWISNRQQTTAILIQEKTLQRNKIQIKE